MDFLLGAIRQKKNSTLNKSEEEEGIDARTLSAEKVERNDIISIFRTNSSKLEKKTL